MTVSTPRHPYEGPTSGLVISLDLELFWGVKDHLRLEDYRQNLLGVRKAIPEMLSLFRQYGIHATWAAVGMLCFEDREQLLASLPSIKPNYKYQSISNYKMLADVGKNESSDPFHFGGSLVRQILDCEGQELGTHTFSHYYCLETGQDVVTFRADLEAANNTAKKFGRELRSIVFPRNQFNPDYLSACSEVGITAYRGSPPFWWCQQLPTRQEKRAWLRRGIRLADNYVNISRPRFCAPPKAEGGVMNVPATRFLRPWSNRFRRFERYRLRRIQEELNVAARNHANYHLWWHPHNFGANLEANLDFLRQILDRFAILRESYGMQSLSMAEAAVQPAAL